MEWSALQTHSEFYGINKAAAFLNSIDCTYHIAEWGKKDAAYKASNVISVLVNKFGAEEEV